MRLILIVAFVAVLGQQAKPDFSGDWVINIDKSAKAIKEDPATNERLTLKVNEKDVTLVHQVPGLVCGFGKVPVENDQVLSGALCSAKWDGDHLVVTLTRKSNPNLASPSNPLKPPKPSDPILKLYQPFTEIRLSRAGTELKVTQTIHLASGSEVKRPAVVYERVR